ncbi:MAG: arylsulfatase A-like enzyme, partial [Candidatus Paceibacteria bacterium]
GLARGFDAYSEAMMGHDLVQMDSQWSRFRSELLLWVFKNKLQQRVDSSLVVTTARGWLREHKGKRWMAMVHLYSTHTPYDPPKNYKQPYLDPTYSGPFSSFYAEHRYALERGDYEPTAADVQRIRDLYMAGAAQADAQIGELMAEIEELGMLDETLVILTSDHGEDLGEWRGIGVKGREQATRIWEHNHMWQTNLRVPLILANTRLLPHGKRVQELVESVDLMPTLCELMGLELPVEDGELKPEIDGQSLVPLMLGAQRGESASTWNKPYTFSENGLFFVVQSAKHKLIVPRFLLKENDPTQLFDGEKWVRFYDLTISEAEENNDLEPDDPRVLELWNALWQYNESMPEADYILTERDLDMAELFNALGYNEAIDPALLEAASKGAEPGSE